MTKIKNTPKKPARLNRSSFLHAVHCLTDCDPGLAEIVRKFGPSPMWQREEGFAPLVHIILEQQVSLSSARAAYDRLIVAAAPLTPERFLQFNDAELKIFGFSRQKTAYCRNLAHAILKGDLDLTALRTMDDATVRSELTKIKGIGIWTADIYLLTVLLRPDVWPGGDLALAVAIQSIKGLPNRPSLKEMDAFSRDWMPWRAVAARLLWHYYLNNGHRDNEKV
jgi:DNA-3-methyladenine glycosylase II